jgi:Predicted integral membrane protein (DUF2269)
MLLAASAYELLLALHIIAVVLAFGWTFMLPIGFAVAAKADPRTLPVLHRIEYTCSRLLLNPALTVIVAAGTFMAIDGHLWGEFFVQWGIGAALVIGALAGSVLIPAAKRAEAAVRRDLEDFDGGGFQPGEEYRAATRRLTRYGSLTSLLALATIAIMVVKP